MLFIEALPLHHVKVVDIKIGRMNADQFGRSAETIANNMLRFLIDTQIDEVMVSSNIFDPNAKLRSYELFAEIVKAN